MPNFSHITELIASGAYRLPESDTTIVTVSGGSASGKSYLSRLLSRTLGDHALIVHLDDFQLGYDFVNYKNSIYKWDDPKNFSSLEVISFFDSLFKLGKAKKPIFNLKENIRRADEELVFVKKVIILEGLYASSFLNNAYNCLNIYCESPFYVRFLRRIFRFINDVDSSKKDVPVRHMLNNVRLAHDDFIVTQKNIAKVILNSGFNFDLEIIEKYNLSNTDFSFNKGKILFSIDFNRDLKLNVLRQTKIKFLLEINYNSKCIFFCEINDSDYKKLKNINWDLV